MYSIIMKRLCKLFMILLLAASCCSDGGRSAFVNPVIRGDIPDPTVIRIGDTYYLSGTSSEWAPHYPIFASEDLVNWDAVGHVFGEKPEWAASSFWAPELFYRNGTTYCYYTARKASDGISCIGVASSQNPTGGFTDHGTIVEYGSEAIDAFVYDDEGRLYITWKAYGLDDRPIEILGARLSEDGLRLEGEPFSMLRDDERIGMEGQYIFKEGGYYYMIYAARGCCGPGSDYEVRVARSDTFEGPYEKYEANPILIGGEDFMSCGHGTGVRTPDGRHFYIFHAYLKDEGFFQGRQPILQELYVGDDDWPHFVSGECACAVQKVPFKGVVQRERLEFEDDFDAAGLKKEWSWNYIYSDIDAHTENGRLLLGGRALYDGFNGSVLCMRASSDNYTYQVKVYRPETGSAGLTMYGGNMHMLAWGYNDGRLVLEQFKGKEHSILFSTEIGTDSVCLMVEVREGQKCSFFWSENSSDWHSAEIGGIGSKGMTQWDRVSRPGLRFSGPDSAYAAFDDFVIRN